MIRKHIEIYDYEKNQINVSVKIDYINNEISLLDSDMTKKKYVFADRGVEYMNGWLNVLDTMREAIQDAKKKYEANLAEVSKFKKKLVRDVYVKLAKTKYE